ncbi:MAG: HD domain-containing protein [Treponema sp.]|nr:HD domain-containing protein [Treponema sp.]
MDNERPSENIYIPHILLTAPQTLTIIRRMLLAIGEHIYEGKRMDYIQESERTAYIAVLIAKYGQFGQLMPLKDIFLLSLFSNIGSYRFILPNFTSSIENVAERDYTYSYYFLKYMSPIGENTKFLFFYNEKYNPLLAQKVVQAEYAHLIFFAARIESFLRKNKYYYTPKDIETLDPADSGPDYVKLFLEADRQWNIVNNLKNGSFLLKIDEWSSSISYDYDNTFKLVKMLIYIMDFKSTATVSHTINAACFAAALGQRMHCTPQETDELYTAGILHDIGKMAIDSRILEYPGKLSKENMEIMRTHVINGISMYHNVISSRIGSIASHHHEKLNGTGYPEKLSERELSLQDRILTAADITSALIEIRSYKDSFSKEKIIQIISEMTESGQLDSSVTKCVINQFDSLKTELGIRRKSLSAEFGRISAEFQAAEMTENL